MNRDELMGKYINGEIHAEDLVDMVISQKQEIIYLQKKVSDINKEKVKGKDKYVGPKRIK